MNITTEQLEYLRRCHPQIAIPCYGGQLFECVFMSMLKFVIYCNKLGINFSIDTMVNESLIPRARNSLVAKMMANTEATHLMFIDADIGFEPEHIFRLLLHDRDFVGGLYPKKTMPIDYVVNVDPAVVGANGEIATQNGLIPVTHLGTGFMLIKRQALQKLFDAYPETHYQANIGLDPSFNKFMYAIFDTYINADGIYESEDYTACDRWRALGGEIWADTTIKLDHTGYYRYVGDPEKLSAILGTPQTAGISQNAGDLKTHQEHRPIKVQPRAKE